MCRINGFWDFSGGLSESGARICEQMRDTMAYGGPDAAGFYSDEKQSLFLGHRRLSIIDLSEAGNQPMRYKNTVIVFNGEIYNFQNIRAKLEERGRQFKTTSDTEIILQAWEEWGTEAVEKFTGMFAFAIWDIEKQKLTICRDRLGVKPIYWYWKEGLFLFASELKAFHQHPDFDKTLSPKAISLFLQQGYIQSPFCIFQYVQKLKPGSFLEIDENQNIREWTYWDPVTIYENSEIDDRPFDVLKKDLEEILTDSFQLRMVADVPVGLFLSGGIDSSLLTAILQKNMDRPLKTFTIGVDDPIYDEAPHARAIATHLGTDHTELYITEKDIIDLVAQLDEMCDEPLGDTSVFPTHLVAKLARKEVTVSLSADGGDELFGGYTRYEVAYNQYPSLEKIPSIGRNMMRSFLNVIDPNWLEKNKQYFPILRKYKQMPHKIHKLKQALKSDNVIDFFMTSGAYNDREILAPIQKDFYQRFEADLLALMPNRSLGLFGLIDIQTYLEGNILTKVDRASMQVALEARDPFLDQRIVEFALKLGDGNKIKGKSTKHILREILYQYVPSELIDRPKQGFTIPMHRWLRTHFRNDLVEMMEDPNFAKIFSFHKEGIKTLVRSFLGNRRFVDHHLVWFLYVLFRWQKRWLS